MIVHMAVIHPITRADPFPGSYLKGGAFPGVLGEGIDDAGRPMLAPAMAVKVERMKPRAVGDDDELDPFTQLRLQQGRVWIYIIIEPHFLHYQDESFIRQRIAGLADDECPVQALLDAPHPVHSRADDVVMVVPVSRRTRRSSPTVNIFAARWSEGAGMPCPITVGLVVDAVYMDTRIDVELIDEGEFHFITFINFYRGARHRAVVRETPIRSALGHQSDMVRLGYDVTRAARLAPRWDERWSR